MTDRDKILRLLTSGREYTSGDVETLTGVPRSKAAIAVRALNVDGFLKSEKLDGGIAVFRITPAGRNRVEAAQ